MMKTNLSMTQMNTSKAYCIRGQDQLSIFSEAQLTNMTPLNKRRTILNLFALIEDREGYSWWQEIERKKGETPWQSCMRYKRESLGKGYWVCTYELRH